VDENAKVWNTDKLFVVNASIIPGEINATFNPFLRRTVDGILPGMPVGNPQAAIMSLVEQAISVENL